MDKDHLRAFLHRVANDQGYRNQLETDPVGTFTAMGLTLDPADIPAGGVVLPPADEIRANLDDLVEKFWAKRSPNHHYPYIWLGGG